MFIRIFSIPERLIFFKLRFNVNILHISFVPSPPPRQLSASDYEIEYSRDVEYIFLLTNSVIKSLVTIISEIYFAACCCK
jgi:hypothetical protein